MARAGGQPRADGLARGFHRPAAGDDPRPGEPAGADRGHQPVRGAEVRGAHGARAALPLSAHEQCGLQQDVRGTAEDLPGHLGRDLAGDRAGVHLERPEVSRHAEEQGHDRGAARRGRLSGSHQERLEGLHDKEFIQSVLKMCLATLLAGAAIQILKYPVAALVNMQTFLGVFIQLVVTSVGGVLVYIGMSKLLKLEEFEFMFQTIKNFLKRKSVPSAKEVVLSEDD